MRIVIEGINYKISPMVNRFQQYLRNTRVGAYFSVVGKCYPQSKVKYVVTVPNGDYDMLSMLENADARVEVVEETPGVIFTYVSEYNQTNFSCSSEDDMLDTTYNDFEDDESYSQRMYAMGVLV